MWVLTVKYLHVVLQGYLSWLSGVIDNALYPGLAIEVVTEVWGGLNSATAEYFIKAGITVLLSLPGYFGIQIVGVGMFVLGIAVMLPFIVSINIFYTAIMKSM